MSIHLIKKTDLLKGDIIEGKSSGTTILCKGLPGTGKTLTAEIYSEITHRPLYKISSGQLGVEPEKVEENLQAILSRAERWGAVMLIDEADTFIRSRGDNIKQNAIVAAFLRTLEYFNGLLFMTTNRSEDVDDAIASRCIAEIKYTYPTKENLTKIWQVLSKQFNIDLSLESISEFVEYLPSISGRDVKELLKLMGRYSIVRKVPVDLALLKMLAQFRGIKK